MSTVRVVNDPRHAAILAAPVRQRILDALAEPGSATTIAKSLGLARQLVAYHVRQLEDHGFVELAREERRRGCTERVVRRTSHYLVASPEMFARQGVDPRKFKDKFSSGYLIALASRMAREVGEAQSAAERAGKPLATLSTELEVRLRSPKERQAFADELLDAIAKLVDKYHDADYPDGRSYRLVVGAHPIRPTKASKRNRSEAHVSELKTKPTEASAESHIAAIANEEQRNDAQTLVALMRRVTKQEPRMWGPSIIGFGSYHYKYASGHEGDSALAGFAVRGNELIVYIAAGFDGRDDLLAKLGRHKTGKVCVYIKRLANVDLKILETLAARSVAETKRRYPKPQ